jgi:cytochrome c-type biogenesis protein CcmH/NrfG
VTEGRVRVTALVLAALVAGWLVVAGGRGVVLIGTGEPIAMLLGVAVLAFPLVGAWLLLREVRFGAATQRLGRRLLAEGGLPSADLPRRPSGRVDRAAADAQFAERRADVDADPQDWRGWYRLALAYDDAGDRRRARSAMRYAVALAGSDPS